MRLHQIPLSASLQNIGALLAGGLVSFLFLTLSAPAPCAVRGRAGLCRHAAVRRGARLHLSGFRHRGHFIAGFRLGPLALNAAFAFVPVALIGMDLLFRSGNPARGLRAESADRRAAVSPAGRLHERRLRHGRAARAVARGYRPGAAADRLGDSDGACGSVVGMAQIARTGCAGGGGFSRWPAHRGRAGG